MTFQLVRADAADCQPACPEWIAAQGAIKPSTAKTFAAFLAGLDGRRRPLLINSGGGSVEAAMEMGRLIRARGLAVAVAHTDLTLNTPGEPTRAATGHALGAHGYCMSACVLVLAAGVERYASAVAAVGVHEVKQTLTHKIIHRQFLVHYRIVGGQKIETSRDLVSETSDTQTTTLVAPSAVNARIGDYFRDMGETPKLLDLFATAAPEQIHRMSADEEKETKIVTAWLDRYDAMATDFPDNGLTGAPVDPARGDLAALEARQSWRLDDPPDASLGQLSLKLTLRRGGGGVTANWNLDLARKARLRWGFNPRTPDRRRRDTPDGHFVSVFIPANAFCAYARYGDVFVRFGAAPPTQAPGLPDPRAPLMETPVAAIPGVAALTDEICPTMTARR